MDTCVKRLNNIPIEETNQYYDSFTKMLSWITPKIPKGVEVKYTRYADLYENMNDFEREMDVSV